MDSRAGEKGPKAVKDGSQICDDCFRKKIMHIPWRCTEPGCVREDKLCAEAFSEWRAERVKKGLKDEKDGRQSCSDCSRKKIPSPWRCKERGCVRKDKLSTEAVSEWIAERVDKGQKAEENGRLS